MRCLCSETCVFGRVTQRRCVARVIWQEPAGSSQPCSRHLPAVSQPTAGKSHPLSTPADAARALSRGECRMPFCSTMHHGGLTEDAVSTGGMTRTGAYPVQLLWHRTCSCSPHAVIHTRIRPGRSAPSPTWRRHAACPLIARKEPRHRRHPPKG